MDTYEHAWEAREQEKALFTRLSWMWARAAEKGLWLFSERVSVSLMYVLHHHHILRRSHAGTEPEAYVTAESQKNDSFTASSEIRLG